MEAETSRVFSGIQNIGLLRLFRQKDKVCGRRLSESGLINSV